MQTYVRRLRMQGGSLVCAVPRPLANMLDLSPGDYVTVVLNTLGSLAIAKAPIPNRSTQPEEQRA